MSTEQNIYTENKIEDKPKIIEENRDKPSKQIKKKKRRKPTDPEVKDVTELFSNNLSLISLENSVEKAKRKNNTSDECSKYDTTNDADNRKSVKNNYHGNSKKNDENLDNNEEIKPTISNMDLIRDTESDSKNHKHAPKVNAFQFMMNSRNTIIGQNSNGKTVSEQDSSVIDQKSKLATRKDLLKSWADEKGGLKRKREEDEIEKCIDYKLKKRTKRLKKLLRLKTEASNCKNIEKTESPAKSKKIVKILSSSDSETSNDLSKNKSNTLDKSSSSQLAEVTEENAQDAILTISCSPTKKQHKENNQNNLLNFFEVLSKEERIEVFEDSSEEPPKELIKIKMFTPESTKKRTSLLSLNRERTKSMTDDSSQESSKAKKHKKEKKKKNKVRTIEEDSQSELQLNDSLEDFCSPKTKKINSRVKKYRKDKLKINVFDNEADKQKELNGSLVKDRLGHSFQFSISKEGIDESTSSDSDIIRPKKKRIKHCLIADDSEDSRNSLGQNILAVDTPIIKPKAKIKYQLCIIDDDSQESKTLVDDLVQVTEDLDVTKCNKTKFHKGQLNKDVWQDSTSMTQKPKKKHNMKTKVSKTSSRDIESTKDGDKLIMEDTESRGRILRPKKANLNYSDLLKDGKSKSLKTDKKVKIGKNSLNKDDSIENIELSSDSNYENTPLKKPKVTMKVAPVFLKATPKPKLDPEVIEARKKFLLSGVPDSLKKTVEKQRSIEEKEYDIFPRISHVQQKCQSKLWDLPKLDLIYAPETPFTANESSLIAHDLIVRKTYEINITTDFKKISHIKSLLYKIKAENPNYPVYKIFRQIYEKSGKNFRKGKKNTRNYTEPVKLPKSDATILKDCEMWSEKYKPRSSEEILGNNNGVSALKNWLDTWMNYSEEINARGKRKRTDSNSETEFESTDGDSRDSTRFPGNTMIVGGPCGSGKTCAVYAIANDLGFNVLELNASSKRTGKRLIQELQEATQSHQVRKNGNNALTNYVNPDKAPSKRLKSQKIVDVDQTSDRKDKKKMCILLVEDVDLVFDQDDGFLTSLFQLITTSKRPLILTTTDNSPAHVQKLITQYEYISFLPLSKQCMGVWLQIVCLVEGLLADKDDLGNLLEYNKGDIRKTLLEVQFWCQSGGQIERSRVFPLKNRGTTCNYDLKIPDEELKIADLSEGDVQKNYFVHKHCVGSFVVFRENKEYIVPRNFDLGTLWWNIPNILNVPSCALQQQNRLEGEKSEIISDPTTDDVGEMDETKLIALMSLYDSLSVTDTLFKTVNYPTSNEPTVTAWSTDVRDSLELSERREDGGIHWDMVHDLTHTLVNGCVENYRRINGTNSGWNMALPDAQERSWRAKQHIGENFLKQPIPLINAQHRSSIAVDYLPALRGMARSEDKRASTNTKRRNRFRHYFKNLNMDFKESSCKLACDTLSVNDNDHSD